MKAVGETGRSNDVSDRAERSREAVTIEVDSVRLKGLLSAPGERRTTVVFAHGSGSGMQSPRNLYVAGVLRQAGFGTLLFDLLTSQEDSSFGNRFDIDMLARRLAGVSRWLLARDGNGAGRLAYFGASTGAAAALQASVDVDVRSIVSRGGRPDLAMDFLPRVKAPTLLVVGGLDEQVIGLNEEALARLQVTKRLVIVPGASHLFEEPGKLEEVARLATEWFIRFD